MVSRNVMFDENANWKWRTTEKEIELVPANEIDEVGDQTCNHTDSEEENPSSTAETSRTEPEVRVYRRRDRNPDITGRKTKTLQELYETTQVLLFAYLTNYEEAEKGKNDAKQCKKKYKLLRRTKLGNW